MNATKKMGLVLLVSLMLNAFAAGALFNDWWRDDDPPAAGPAKPPGWHRKDIPPALAEMFAPPVGERRERFGDEFQAVRQARRAVREALLANPFEPDALAEEFARLRAAESALAKAAQQHITGLAAELGPDERRWLAQRLERWGRLGPPRPGLNGPPARFNPPASSAGDS